MLFCIPIFFSMNATEKNVPIYYCNIHIMDVNIDVAMIMTGVIVFIITVVYLNTFNICDQGLCKIYDQWSGNFIIWMMALVFVLTSLALAYIWG